MKPRNSPPTMAILEKKPNVIPDDIEIQTNINGRIK